MSSGSPHSLQNRLTKIQYISLSSSIFCVLFLHLFSIPIFGFFPTFLYLAWSQGTQIHWSWKTLGLSQVSISSGNQYSCSLVFECYGREGERKLVRAAVAVQIPLSAPLCGRQGWGGGGFCPSALLCWDPPRESCVQLWSPQHRTDLELWERGQRRPQQWSEGWNPSAGRKGWESWGCSAWGGEGCGETLLRPFSA